MVKLPLECVDGQQSMTCCMPSNTCNTAHTCQLLNKTVLGLDDDKGLDDDEEPEMMRAVGCNNIYQYALVSNNGQP